MLRKKLFRFLTFHLASLGNNICIAGLKSQVLTTGSKLGSAKDAAVASWTLQHVETATAYQVAHYYS